MTKVNEQKPTAEAVRVEYVLGFIFSDQKERVALIRKAKPIWQRGKLNGIGGKIESESKNNAMVRECKEECGLQTHGEQWDYFCRMEGNDFTVHCFATVGDLSQCQTVESEKIEIVYVSEIKHLQTQMIENLPWLLYLAIDHLDDKRPFFTVAAYDCPAPFANDCTATALGGNGVAMQFLQDIAKWSEEKSSNPAVVELLKGVTDL